jgi:hypothetical protein
MCRLFYNSIDIIIKGKEVNTMSIDKFVSMYLYLVDHLDGLNITKEQLDKMTLTEVETYFNAIF